MTKIIYNIVLGDFSNYDKQEHIHDVKITGFTSSTTGQDRARPSNHCRSLEKQYPHNRKQ